MVGAQQGALTGKGRGRDPGQGPWTPQQPEGNSENAGCGGGNLAKRSPNLSRRGNQGASLRNIISLLLKMHSSAPRGVFLQLLETKTLGHIRPVDKWSVPAYDCGCEQITIY